MKAVWTRTAIRDLTNAREYIARENPAAAREIALQIVEATERIIQFPEVGRIGRVNRTREFVVSGNCVLIIYRFEEATRYTSSGCSTAIRSGPNESQ